MMHEYYVKAVQIKQTHVLQKIYDQWQEFTKTLEALSQEQKAKYLKELIIDHKLIVNFDKRLPYFYTPSEEIQILGMTDTPCYIVFIHIIQSLKELKVVRERLYTTKGEVVIIWTDDFPKLSKNLKGKLKMKF